jgi:Flp pilus assembly protein TadG
MRSGRSAKSCKSDAGSVLVMTAIALPALIAVAALSLDVGYIYDYRQRMGAAADAAAMSAAFEVRRNSSVSQGAMEGYARDDAGRNGFIHGNDNITVTATRGNFSGGVFTAGASATDKYVEVVISRPVPTFLLGLIGWTTMTVDASAIGGPGGGSKGCVYALNTSSTSYPIELDIASSSGILDVPDCSVVSNGDFTVDSGNTVTAMTIDVGAATGTINGTVCVGSGCGGAIAYNASPSADPLLDMDQAALFGNPTNYVCDHTDFEQDAGDVSPGVYCASSGKPAIKIGGDEDVALNFLPGQYYFVGGGADWKHTLITGTGVTFYFTYDAAHPYPSCGSTIFASDPPDHFQLSAPTSGAYEGLLFIQDRRANPGCTTNKVNLIPDDFQINGVIYFPTHHLLFGAGTDATISGAYTILIGDTIEFTRTGATLRSDFSGLASGSPIKNIGIAR